MPDPREITKKESLLKLHRKVLVLATGKQETLQQYKAQYPRRKIIGINPEYADKKHPRPEPEFDESEDSVVFKLWQILIHFKPYKIDELGRQDEIGALASDAIFINPEGQVSHKGSRNTRDESQYRAYLEAKDLYCSDPFLVHWIISFGYQTAAGDRKIATLDIEGKYLKPLTEEDVHENYNPRINSGLPLVELAKKNPVEFSVSNKNKSERIVISQQLAHLLIIEKALPHALLDALITGSGEVEELGKIEGQRVFFDLENFDLTALSPDQNRDNTSQVA